MGLNGVSVRDITLLNTISVSNLVDDPRRICSQSLGFSLAFEKKTEEKQNVVSGFISIPLYVLYYTVGRWPLGEVLCKSWLMLDYSLCYASMLSIFVICIDRFWSVSKPAHYLQNANFDVAFWFLCPVWTYPMLLFIIMVWLWPVLLR